MKIAYLINHTALNTGEVLLLQKMGHLVYTQNKSSRNYHVSELDSLDFYKSQDNSVYDFFLKNFDIIMLSLPNSNFYISFSQYSSAMQIYIRLFGRESNYTYEEEYKKISSFSNISFLYTYKDILLNEPDYSHHKYKYLGLTRNYSFDTFGNSWTGTQNKLLFVCSYIEENEYYTNIYYSFKKLFNNYPHTILGKQKVPLGELLLNDDTVLTNLSFDKYVKEFQESKVMFYHSNEKRHIHYHPIEAVMIGLPVVFMANGLFDLFTNYSSAGRCVNEKEAQEKIFKILNGDDTLAKQIQSDNKKLLDFFSDDAYQREFEFLFPTNPSKDLSL
jgi:hypothetical protein